MAGQHATPAPAQVPKIDLHKLEDNHILSISYNFNEDKTNVTRAMVFFRVFFNWCCFSDF